jgi:membrane protein implicated in regulation of membrane protease activity
LVEAGRLTPAQVEGVALMLNTTWVDPWVGGVRSFISETGSWAVFAAVLLAAAALLLARKAPWPPLLVLLAFGWQPNTAHASPHGPIAFALLIVAAIWLWWAERKAAHRKFTAEDLRG